MLSSPFLPSSAMPSITNEDDDQYYQHAKLSGNNWQEHERLALQQALDLYGQDWEKVATFVGTKPAQQVLAYAQHFLKENGIPLERLRPAPQHRRHVDRPAALRPPLDDSRTASVHLLKKRKVEAALERAEAATAQQVVNDRIADGRPPKVSRSPSVDTSSSSGATLMLPSFEPAMRQSSLQAASPNRCHEAVMPHGVSSGAQYRTSPELRPTRTSSLPPNVPVVIHPSINRLSSSAGDDSFPVPLSHSNQPRPPMRVPPDRGSITPALSQGVSGVLPHPATTRNIPSEPHFNYNSLVPLEPLPTDPRRGATPTPYLPPVSPGDSWLPDSFHINHASFQKDPTIPDPSMFQRSDSLASDAVFRQPAPNGVAGVENLKDNSSMAGVEYQQEYQTEYQQGGSMAGVEYEQQAGSRMAGVEYQEDVQLGQEDPAEGCQGEDMTGIMFEESGRMALPENQGIRYPENQAGSMESNQLHNTHTEVPPADPHQDVFNGVSVLQGVRPQPNPTHAAGYPPTPASLSPVYPRQQVMAQQLPPFVPRPPSTQSEYGMQGGLDTATWSPPRRA